MDEGFSMVARTFRANARLFEKATYGVPSQAWFSKPGSDSNHMLWIAAHVVVHRAKVPKMLGLEWSAPWEKLFVRGSQLIASEEYPAVEEIHRAWVEVSDKLSTALVSPSPEILGKPAPKESPSLDGKIGGLIAFLSLHETYHVGQMSYLRKWLGHGQSGG